MDKHCQSCVKEGIGCESVQKMMREIDELKKAKAHWGFFITFTVLFVLFAGMLIYNTWPQKVKDSVISINVVEAKEKTAGDEMHISKNALEDTLLKSAYAARREAQQEYDRNFSTLLTILTIFGIAWPLIVAFAQYKFNERELDKIQDTDKRATEAFTRANTASEKATNALNNANEASRDAKSASDDATKALSQAEKMSKDIKETNLLTHSLIDFSKSSNLAHWNAMLLIYVKMGNQMRMTGEDEKFPSAYNFNKLMTIYCVCLRVSSGRINKINIDDAQELITYISNVFPEKNPDYLSNVNKSIATGILDDLNTFKKNTEDQSLKELLGQIIDKTTQICEIYARLVSENGEDDPKA